MTCDRQRAARREISPESASTPAKCDHQGRRLTLLLLISIVQGGSYHEELARGLGADEDGEARAGTGGGAFVRHLTRTCALAANYFSATKRLNLF